MIRCAIARPRPVSLAPSSAVKNGLKMWVTDETIVCEAITFRAEGMNLLSEGARVSLAYSPSINTWQGVSTLQLDLKDLKTD